MNCALLCLLLALAELVSGQEALHIVFSGVSAHGEMLRPLTLRVTLADRLEVSLESAPLESEPRASAACDSGSTT